MTETPACVCREGERGLTLVEVLVSLLLMSFVALGSITLITVASRQDKLAGQRSVATSLALERMEALTSRPFSPAASYTQYQLPGEVAAAGPPQTLTSDYGTLLEFPDYRRQVTLEYEVPVAGMLKLTTAVSWQDLTQGTKTHTLVTYLHPRVEAR